MSRGASWLTRSLPRGTPAIGVGLVTLGVSAYLFLGLAGRALGPESFAPLSVVWVLVNAIAPGLFAPLEQEVSRSIASRRARGVGEGPIVARAAAIGGGLGLAVTLVALALAPALIQQFFAGDPWLFAAFLFSLASIAAAHLSRGVFAGRQQYTRYGSQLALDGALRVVGAAALVVAGAESAAAFAAVLAVAPLLAVLGTVAWPIRFVSEGPDARYEEVSRALGLLLVASLASQSLMNAAPLVAQALARPGEQAVVSQVLTGLVLARIPLFLFAAVQAALLPGLARLAAQGDRAGFLTSLRRTLAVVAALGAAGLAAVAIAGPWITNIVFGPGFELPRGVLVLFAASTALFMLSGVLAQTLVSLRGYGAAAFGWVAGCVAFGAACTAPLSLEVRMGWALFAGSAAALLAFGALLLRRLRQDLGPAHDPDLLPPDGWTA